MSFDSLVWGVSWFVLTLVLQTGTEKSLLLERLACFSGDNGFYPSL